jgi:segregation and condensation protein A
MSFRVDLDIFRGPLDLLLYLVRKHEVEVTELPVARITEQYLEHLEVLREIDVNAVGDFLEVASTLVELKSRLVLPHGGEVEEPLEDARQDLVRQLLEYKRFKEAATLLEERGRAWQTRYPRLAGDAAPHERDPAEEPIHELELWDLVSAFGRVLREHQAVQAATIVYDETPIHVHMARIHDRLRERGRMAFRELFPSAAHKSTLVGLFLALLELVRHYGVRAEQETLFGDIWVVPGEARLGEIDFAPVQDYEHGRADVSAGEPTDTILPDAGAGQPEANAPTARTARGGRPKGGRRRREP